MKDRNQNQKEVSQEYEGTALKIAAVLPDGMLRTGVGRGSKQHLVEPPTVSIAWSGTRLPLAAARE